MFFLLTYLQFCFATLLLLLSNVSYIYLRIIIYYYRYCPSSFFFLFYNYNYKYIRRYYYRRGTNVLGRLSITKSIYYRSAPQRLIVLALLLSVISLRQRVLIEVLIQFRSTKARYVLAFFIVYDYRASAYRRYRSITRSYLSIYYPYLYRRILIGQKRFPRSYRLLQSSYKTTIYKQQISTSSIILALAGGSRTIRYIYIYVV